MSTGSFSITSVQPAALTPSSTPTPASTGDSNGFSALYQTTLNGTPAAQDANTAPAAQDTHADSANANRAKTPAQANADTSAPQKQSAAQRRDKTHATAEADTAAQIARRRPAEAEDVDEEAANDMLASMAVEQMMANEPSLETPATLTESAASPKGASAAAVTAPTTAVQAAQTSDARNEALQQAMALQQLVDQKRSESTSTAGATDALKAAAQAASSQESASSERRVSTPFSMDSAAPSADRSRGRSTPTMTNTQTSATAASQNALAATRVSDDSRDVDAPSSRSQADFGLQHALSQVGGGSDNGTQAATGAATLPAIDSDHWNQALASHISTMSRLDQGQTTLTLAPASLGSLEVSLQMDRGQADIQFVTRSRQAHDALTSSVNALHHALADQGIQLQNVSVVEHNPDAGQQTSQQQHAFSGMASDQQSSQQSFANAREQANAETRARSSHDESVDAGATSDTATSTVNGLRATA